MRKSSKAIELQNANLVRQNALMRERIELQNDVQAQGLSALVASAFAQTNVTSFLPALQNNIYAPLTLNWNLLMYMYKTHGILQTAIDVPVLDAYRDGIEIISGELSEDEIHEIEKDLKEGVLGTYCDAKIWTRLFGGGGLVINDGGDPESEFDPENLKEGAEVEFYDVNRWELGAPHRVSEFYDFYGQKIHNSRVVTMIGKRAPYIIRWQLAGWGMSEFERMVEPFNLYLRQINVIYEIMEEAKIDVYKLKNFNTQLGSLNGTKMTEKRVQLMNQLKNYNRAIIMDAEDEFDQKQLTFGGLADMLKETRIGIAAALRMPLTKIFGLSAAGFNSGEDDIENYNAMVESEIRTPGIPELRKILDIMFMVKFGYIPEYDYKHKPLRVMGQKEEEEVNTSKQNRILTLYDRQLADSQEVGEMLKKDKLTSVELKAEQGLLDPFPANPNEPAQGEGENGNEEAGGKSKPGSKRENQSDRKERHNNDHAYPVNRGRDRKRAHGK